MRALASFALSSLVLGAGCGADVIGTRVARDQLGTPRARLSGMLATDSGGHGEWIYAGDWTDVFTLVDEQGRLCIDLELRDPEGRGLADLELRLAVDGRSVPATVLERAVEDIAAIVDDSGRMSSAGVRIRGQVCAPPGPARRVDLHVLHRLLGWRRDAGSEAHRYQARYRWTIVGG